MTTAQRAREMAEYCRRYGDRNVAGETSAAFNDLARMLESALPERLQAIADWHEHVSSGKIEDDITAPAHRDRATLLDAVLVLTAERQANDKRKRSIICIHCAEVYTMPYSDEEVRAHPAVLAEAYRWAKAHDAGCKQNPVVAALDTARAEVERLNRARVNNRKEWHSRETELDAIANAIGYSGETTGLLEAVKDVKRMADVLAEGVRLHRKSADRWKSAYEQTQEWEREHGYLVTK